MNGFHIIPILGIQELAVRLAKEIAERFVLSIKAECLDRLVILGERHLRRAIAEYVEHYHQERTHQGLGNRVIEGVPEPNSGRVARRERLGGILSHYYRDAA